MTKVEPDNNNTATLQVSPKKEDGGASPPPPVDQPNLQEVLLRDMRKSIANPSGNDFAETINILKTYEGQIDFRGVKSIVEDETVVPEKANLSIRQVLARINGHYNETLTELNPPKEYFKSKVGFKNVQRLISQREDNGGYKREPCCTIM